MCVDTWHPIGRDWDGLDGGLRFSKTAVDNFPSMASIAEVTKKFVWRLSHFHVAENLSHTDKRHTFTTKIRSPSSTRTKRGLGTILWTIDENMGTNPQAFYKQLHFVEK